MRFLFTCGGTAGHINPAIAIATRLREMMPDAEFLFIGTGREMENRLIPAAGFKVRNIKITGFSRSISLNGLASNMKTVRNIWISMRESKKILREFRPDIVIGTGGYVCYPVISTASKMGVPTLMHESNAIFGLTTKMLADKVSKIMVAFPVDNDSYKHPEKIVVTGTPIRTDFAKMTKEAAKSSLGLDDKPLVLSVWGSLGAEMMNEYMADFIIKAAEENWFNIIHSTGGGPEGMGKMYAKLKQKGLSEIPENVDIRAYIDNMGTVMTAADLVLCRAGASTIAELTNMGVPAIIVPSPNVVNNHQEKNARAVEASGGAKMILEKDCNGEILYKAATDLLRDHIGMQKMSEDSKKLGAGDSADKIIETILSLVN